MIFLSSIRKVVRRLEMSSFRHWEGSMSYLGEDKKIAGYVSKVQNLIHVMKGCGKVLADKMIL